MIIHRRWSFYRGPGEVGGREEYDEERIENFSISNLDSIQKWNGNPVVGSQIVLYKLDHVTEQWTYVVYRIQSE